MDRTGDSSSVGEDIVLDCLDVSALVNAIGAGHVPAALAVLFHASLIEYVFPVFPGDTVILAAAVLVITSGLPATGVFAATMLGGLCGSALNYLLGYLFARAGRHSDQGRLLKHRLIGRTLRRAMLESEKFARHGMLLLLFNRMMPGIRSLLFVAAGMAGMPFLRAMAAGLVSSAVWTGLLLAAGMLVGSNLPRLLILFRTWSIAAWAVTITIVLAWITGRILIGRRRRKQKRD